MGGVITLAVFLPNLLMVFFPPTSRLSNLPQPEDKRLWIMTIIERIGQAGCFAIPFFYPLKLEGVAVGIMLGALVIYYAGWTRYFLRGRNEADLYRSMLGIPIPMASMPILYFAAAAIHLESIWLGLAAILLGVGHFTVSWINSRSVPMVG